MTKKIDYKKIKTKVLRQLFPNKMFNTKPTWHQLVTFCFAMDMNRRRVYLVHDIGTGKTYTSLCLAQLYKGKRILAIVPNSTIYKTWVPQIKEHTNLTFCVLEGKAKQRKKSIKHTKADIFIINYEGLRWVFGKKKLTGKRIKRSQFVIDPKAFMGHFDTLIIDEAHQLKSFNSIQTQIAATLSAHAKNVIAMSGTPYGSGLEDLWGQYWVLNQGQSLGYDFKEFQQRYFDPIRKGSTSGWGRQWCVWEPKKKAKERLLNKVAHCTIRFDREECWDIPEATYEVRTAKPTKKQIKLINKLIANPTKNPLNAGLRITQILGGHLPNKEKGMMNIFHTPKLDLLLEVLQETKEKVVVFHKFVEEGRSIERFLKKHGITFRSLRGEIKNKDQNYRDFRRKKNIRVLIAHPKCGGVGINLPEASIAIFFSNATRKSVIIRKQAEGRILRPEQKKKCVFIDLLLKGTLDEIIHHSITHNKEVERDVLSYMCSIIHSTEGSRKEKTK